MRSSTVAPRMTSKAAGAATGSKESAAARRKNPRLLANLVAQSHSAIEAYLESATPEDIIKLFEESYCSSLVNFLLDQKKSATKRLFEMMIRHKKRAFLDVITLYYYKDYLINPFPLTLESETRRDLPNHYAIVGVPRAATVEELKLAHKLLASSFSADSFPPSERKIGEERLREIDDAFEILKNPKRRQDLDANLPNISYFYPRRDQSWLEAVNRLVN
jgi:DnaJ-like protein